MGQTSLFHRGQRSVFQSSRLCRPRRVHFTIVYSWVVCRFQCKILLTSRLILTFQGHNNIKSYFGPYMYLGFCWTNCCQILTQGSLGHGLSTRASMGQIITKFEHWVALVGAFQQIKKHLERFECEMYANALRWPPLYKKMSLTITFEVRHLGWWVLHLDICFEGQGISSCHLFWPMTLAFQGHDLCEITFWAISQLLMGKMLPNLTQDSLGWGLSINEKISWTILTYDRTRTRYIGHHYAKRCL